MKKHYVFLGIVLFVAGVLIAPTIHKLHHDHCDTHEHDGSSHNPDTCAICVVANTAFSVASTHITLVSVPLVTGIFVLENAFVLDTFIPARCLARAPPVC